MGLGLSSSVLGNEHISHLEMGWLVKAKGSCDWRETLETGDVVILSAPQGLLAMGYFPVKGLAPLQAEHH